MNVALIEQLTIEARAAAHQRAVFNGNLYEMEETYFRQEFARIIVSRCIDIMNKTAEKATRENTYMGDDVPTFTHTYEIKRGFGMK